MNESQSGSTTVRLTVAQALVRFLAAQYTERDGRRHRLVDACWGIFGHGNVAGLGQALVESGQGRNAPLRFFQGRNEQATPRTPSPRPSGRAPPTS